MFHIQLTRLNVEYWSECNIIFLQMLCEIYNTVIAHHDNHHTIGDNVAKKLIYVAITVPHTCNLNYGTTLHDMGWMYQWGQWILAIIQC